MNSTCFVSGHAWMKFDNDKETVLVCARVPCGIKVKLIKRTFKSSTKEDKS